MLTICTQAATHDLERLRVRKVYFLIVWGDRNAYIGGTVNPIGSHMLLPYSIGNFLYSKEIFLVYRRFPYGYRRFPYSIGYFLIGQEISLCFRRFPYSLGNIGKINRT